MDSFNYNKIARKHDYELLVHKTGSHMVISYIGIWNSSSELGEYLNDVKRALECLSSGFNLIVDLREYRGSESEYVNLHVQAQNLALDAGLNKTVVVMHDNPMLKVTAEYIFNQSGIRPVFINNMNAAENWVAMYKKSK